ncbi:MAG: hypothetical protein MRY83_09980 [Flavobacteriales bacterium]|nr:hypothetical protein [Flavobacteriales bacterium]
MTIAVQIKRTLVNLLKGDILTAEGLKARLPYLVFLYVMLLVYIANAFHSEGIVRKSAKIGGELKELSSEFISVKSDMMFRTKQSQIASSLEASDLGLREAKLAPNKLVKPTK